MIRTDRGASAVLIAASMLFLIGAAALAVDVSGFYQTAASEQRAADLGCLAGAVELPGASEAAFTEAASFVRPNHNKLAGIDPATPDQVVAAVSPTAGEIRRWATDTTTLEIETPVNYGGVYSESTMRVTILQGDATTFGRVLGADEVDITQEAFCGAFSALPAGIFPVGVGASFPGGVAKFDDSQCGDEASTASGSGVCNYLEIPRNEFGGGGTNNLIYNIMLGADWPLTCYNSAGTGGCLSTQVPCSSVPGTPDQPCNQLVSKSGNVPPAMYDGLIGGRTSTSHLGLLAYDSGAIPAPVNPHERPSNGVSSIVRPNSPTSLIEWNTNYLTLPGLHTSTCSGVSDLDYFDDSLGGPSDPQDPTDTCDSTEIDDQPEYPASGGVAYNYKLPPSFEFSQYDCRDRRLVVLPAGSWGPKDPSSPANARTFTITGFELGYILDPIFIDESGDGAVESNDYTQPDNEFVAWEDGPGGTGIWDYDNAQTTSVEQLTLFAVNFQDTNGDGEPEVDITGDCPLTPFDPALEGLIPKALSLVEAP